MSGVSAKLKFSVYLKGLLKSEIPIEDIDLGNKQERLSFYLDENLLDDAQIVFRENDKTVLRKALRRARLEQLG